MKRVLSIAVLLLVCLCSMQAGWIADVGVDVKTSAAINGSMGANYNLEEVMATDMFMMYKDYEAAEVAVAGIWYQIKLERDAMQAVGILAHEESAYYQRICCLVAQRITPKLIDVAKLCLHFPDRALYWGPFLFRITEDVRTLCMQFEHLVTNGKRSFSHLRFLRISDALQPFFNLAMLGNIDWKQKFYDFVSFGRDITSDVLLNDFNVIIRDGQRVIDGTITDELWQRGIGVYERLKEKPEELMRLKETIEGYVEDPSSVLGSVEGILGSSDSLALPNLFTIANYDIEDYIRRFDNASGSTDSTYFTQRWYIVREETSPQHISSYRPIYQLGENNESNGWITWRSKRKLELNSSSTSPEAIIYYEQAKAFVGTNVTGWTDARVNQLNSSDPDYEYWIEWSQVGPVLVDVEYSESNSGGPTVVNTYIYAICARQEVYKKSRGATVVWEKTFDSRTMNLSEFTQECNEVLAGLRNDDPNASFTLKHDDIEEFDVVRPEGTKGVGNVSFIATCTGRSKIIDGDFSWKENGDMSEGCINDVCMNDFCMGVNDDYEDLNSRLQRADSLISQCESKLSVDQAELTRLRNENNILSRLINSSSYNDAQEYRKRFADNQVRINNLMESISEQQTQLNQLRYARNELVNDYAVDDEPHRIPWLMDKLQTIYDLRYDNDGHWESKGCDSAYWKRTAYIPDNPEPLELSCKVTFNRKESHNWLIGRYHRAILNVHWELWGDFTTEDVLESHDFSEEEDEDSRARYINERLGYWRSQYPKCIVKEEYTYLSQEEPADTIFAPHLLWMSDRIRIARDIEYRLNHIYAILVSAEKNIQAIMSIDEWLKDRLNGALTPRTYGNGWASKYIRRWLRNLKHPNDSAYIAEMRDSLSAEFEARRRRQENDNNSGDE